VEVDAAGSPVATAMNLRLRVAGTAVLLQPSQVSVVESAADHALIQAQGEPYPNLLVTTTTRVEYDGVAMVSLTVTPRGFVDVQGLDQEVDISTTPNTRVLKFDTKNVRIQPRAQQIDPSYSGTFLNALGIADGDRSFWWFADNAQGWIWNGPTVTDLFSVSSNTVRLSQHLIGATYRISNPMQLQLNFLATPVRDMGSSWRKERVTGGVGTPEQGLGTLQISWDTAFIHVDLPYTTYEGNLMSQIPGPDLRAYPGLQANKTGMNQAFATWGIQILPYLSLHCLTQIDPGVVSHRAAWEVSPPFVNNDSFNPPWSTTFQKPQLSHRATTFTDYYVSRIATEINNLGMRGIYFDQASIVDSANPAHGAWTDSQGHTQASLDILGTRDFLKRTRNLFAAKGLPGYLFVHASNSELIPAYTFATAIVDGEQFTELLQNSDYMASISLDQARVQFSPPQYGVRLAWLPEFDYFHANDPTWTGSAAQLAAFRDLMTLILLHDGELVPMGVPYAERRSILQTLDAFGTDQAAFVGYWDGGPAAQPVQPDARVSFYLRSNPTTLLLVVGNFAAAAQTVDITVDPIAMGFPAGKSLLVRMVPSNQVLAVSGNQIHVPVAQKNFQLVTVD
jgi:hypothetical protein